MASDPARRSRLYWTCPTCSVRASRGRALVAWRDELELSRRYLSIEQYRLGDRLQMDWRVDGVPDDLPIPQLTLQPLLENALVYGIQPRIEGAWSA